MLYTNGAFVKCRDKFSCRDKTVFTYLFNAEAKPLIQEITLCIKIVTHALLHCVFNYVAMLSQIFLLDVTMLCVFCNFEETVKL